MTKRFLQIIKRNVAPKSTFGTNPKDPWSAKSNIDEGALEQYLSARGINPKFVSTDTKIAHAKSSAFLKWKQDHMFGEEVDKKDTVTLDIPLLIRVLELAREDIKSDMDLHRVVERLINIRNKGMLTMDDYDFIAHIKEEVLDEAKMPRTTALDRWRKAATEREIKHNDIEKKRQEKLHQDPSKVTVPVANTQKDDLTLAIDRLEKHLNKEEVELEEAKHYPYSYRATYHHPDKDEVTHYMDFKHRSLEAAKKHAEGSRLQRKDGKEDRLHSVVQMKEETLDELNYDTIKSLYTKRRAMRDEPSKKSKAVKVKNVSTSISRMAGHKTTQNQPFDKVDKGTHYELKPKNEEVELNEDNLDSIAKKHGMEFKRTTYGAGMTHKTKGEVSINRYGEWNHYPAGSRHSKAHGDSSFNFKDLDKHLSTLKEEMKQIDEISREKLDNYKPMASASLKNAQANRDAAEPGKHMSKSFADLHAKSDAIAKKRVKGLMGYLQRKQGVKPMGEDTFADNKAATQTVNAPGEGISERKREMSKSARMIKALYKKHKMVKEDLYDHEKEDKSVATYGKKPKFKKPDENSVNKTENKSQAAAVMSGGTTLTGQNRDDVEIDPAMRVRPGQPDPTKKDDKKKNENKKDK